MVRSAVAPCFIGRSALAVCITSSAPPLSTSQAQPDPNWVVAACANLSLKSSYEPNALLILSATAPEGAPPPPGAMQFQKKVWFQICAELLNRPPSAFMM